MSDSAFNFNASSGYATCSSGTMPSTPALDHYERAKRNFLIHKNIREDIIQIGAEEFVAILNKEVQFDFDTDTANQPIPQLITFRPAKSYEIYSYMRNNSLDTVPVFTGNIHKIASTFTRRKLFPPCLFEVKVRVLALAMSDPRKPVSYGNEIHFLVRDIRVHFPIYRIIYPSNLMDHLPPIQSGTLIKCVGVFKDLYVMQATRIYLCFERNISINLI